MTSTLSNVVGVIGEHNHSYYKKVAAKESMGSRKTSGTRIKPMSTENIFWINI